MMVRAWEYEVVEDSIAGFEAANGVDGAWAQLFASAPGLLGTALHRSVATAGW